jgi:flavin reductase (DIM6/NTAB) family NADH-FMN oxidoreductase RutF
MPVIHLPGLPSREAYSWLIGCITPRPIAWVSTCSAEGRTNLAPFSFFNGITSHPPSLLFCPANDRHGRAKDTLRNIEATSEFVVNVCDFAHADLMNQTAAPLPPEVSEFERFSVPAAPSLKVRPPRVASAPAAFECRLHSIVRVGEGPSAGNVVIGLIQCLHVDERVLGADGMPDAAKLDTLARLGGDLYCRTTHRLQLERPS